MGAKMRLSTIALAVGAAGSAMLAALHAARAVPVSTPVSCNGVQVGTLAADVNSTSTAMTASFISSVGGPPPSLFDAAKACGEDHFNWYQIVTADNHPPRDAAGNPIPVPPPAYVDPPPGGYSNQWADRLPWFWDEVRPPPGTPNFEPDLQLSANVTANILYFADGPTSGFRDTRLSFATWLVSENADGSLVDFHCGFTWSWTAAAGAGQPALIPNCAGPTPAQYANIIGGFDTRIPEPRNAGLVVLGLFFAFEVLRRRSIGA
jgi:hypothetical protein